MLYSTYRPQTLAEVEGQESNLVTLREQIKQKKYDSAYLFAGHRGTGKTTIARILERAICCESPTPDGPCNQCKNCRALLNNATLDCVELDAASHNSISDIKELVASTKYLPSVLPKKIYIIDEVHNLSSSAFDALLKTIEEPPAHCIFILCTTEIHKIPATIKSRCSIYQFHAMSIETINKRLSYVLKNLNKEYEEEAVTLIAKQADGSMRDALSIAEKLIISCDRLTFEHVRKTLCLMEDEIALGIIKSMLHSDGKSSIEMLQALYEQGKNLAQLVDIILQSLTDGVVLKTSEGQARLYSSAKYKEELYSIVRQNSLELLFWFIDQFSLLREAIRNSINPYTDVLLCIMKCCNPKLLNDSKTSILLRLSELEKEVAQIQKNGVYCPNTGIEKSPESMKDMEKKDTSLIQTQNNDKPINIDPKPGNLKDEEGWQHIEEEIPFENDENEQEAVESDKEIKSPEDEDPSSDDEILALFSDYL